MKEIVEAKFKEIFGTEGRYKTYFAPGMVNLMGDNTEHNGGYTLSYTVKRGTYATVREREDRIINFYSANVEELGILSFSIDNLVLVYDPDEKWINYPKSIILTLKNEGFNIDHGFDIVYYTDIPKGIGLSLVASIEVLTANIMNDIYSLDIDNGKIASICKKAEKEYMERNGRITDQFIIANNKKNYAILLNTATLEYQYIRANLENKKIVIINTKSRKEAEEAKYNVRRIEIDTALEELQRKNPNITSLVELTDEEFEENKEAIKDEITRKRAKFVVYENQRTLKAAQALKENNSELFGTLMQESQNSLKYDYEVIDTDIDKLVEITLKQKGTLATRKINARLSNTVISIVDENMVEKFISNVEKEYIGTTGNSIRFYIEEIKEKLNV